MTYSSLFVPSCVFGVKNNSLSCFYPCKKCHFVVALLYQPASPSKVHLACRHLAAVWTHCFWFNLLHFINERRQKIQILLTVTNISYLFVACRKSPHTPLKNCSILWVVKLGGSLYIFETLSMTNVQSFAPLANSAHLSQQVFSALCKKTLCPFVSAIYVFICI